MAKDYSSDALLAFLREETVSGRLHPATARSRRKAADTLFEFLDDSERDDLRNLDIAALVQRIQDAPRVDLREELLELYAQRLASALDDYLGAREALPPAPVTPGSAAERAPQGTDPRAESSALESVRLSFDRYKADVVPIPLERGRVVYLHGMPTDLSPAEAAKIARVVEAFASEKEPGN